MGGTLSLYLFPSLLSLFPYVLFVSLYIYICIYLPLVFSKIGFYGLCLCLESLACKLCCISSHLDNPCRCHAMLMHKRLKTAKGASVFCLWLVFLDQKAILGSDLFGVSLGCKLCNKLGFFFIRNTDTACMHPLLEAQNSFKIVALIGSFSLWSHLLIIYA